MCKDIEEPDRSQMTIWRMRIACWVPKARDAYSECLILIPFPLQQWLSEQAAMLRCRYIDCSVSFDVVYLIRLHVHFF